MTTTIKELHIDLLSSYSALDVLLEKHPEIHQRLDNIHNLYAYSDRLRLFDTLTMLESMYCHFSLLDLKIRILHYSVIQINMFKESEDFVKYYFSFVKQEFALKVNDIKNTIYSIKNILIQEEDLPNIPDYLISNLING